MCTRAEAVEGAVAAEREQLERLVPRRLRSPKMVWLHRQTVALVSGLELPRRTTRGAKSAFQPALCLAVSPQQAATWTLVPRTMQAVWTAQALATTSTLPSASPAPSSRPRPNG
jgi:hypothetical protein